MPQEAACTGSGTVHPRRTVNSSRSGSACRVILCFHSVSSGGTADARIEHIDLAQLSEPVSFSLAFRLDARAGLASGTAIFPKAWRRGVLGVAAQFEIAGAVAAGPLVDVQGDRADDLRLFPGRALTRREGFPCVSSACVGGFSFRDPSAAVKQRKTTVGRAARLKGDPRGRTFTWLISDAIF